MVDGLSKRWLVSAETLFTKPWSTVCSLPSHSSFNGFELDIIHKMSTSLVIPGERPLVELFRRKYLQMEDPHEIEFPPKDLIKSAAAQAWLVENMFDRHHLEHLPTARYTFRIMKKLFSILEAAIEDPEEDEILDELAVCFCEVLGQATQDEMDSVQEKCPVTYTAPSLAKDAPTITLMETPFLLASGGDTGNRTWAAALYLGTYLFSAGRHFIENKTVIELGAGLGFVSILCGKHLRAKHVLMTDGSDAVIRLAQDNVNLNGVDQVVGSTVLQWGSPGIDDVLQPGCQPMQFDLVLGADIVSHANPSPHYIRVVYGASRGFECWSDRIRMG